MSGTYKCPDCSAFQAGLPLEMFYFLADKEEDKNDGREVVEMPWSALQDDSALKKLLSFQEDEFSHLCHEWESYVQRVLDSVPEARLCNEKLGRMVEEVQVAVDKYGYLTEPSLNPSLTYTRLLRESTTQLLGKHPSSTSPHK